MNQTKELDIGDKIIEEKLNKCNNTRRAYIRAIIGCLLSKDDDWLDKLYRKLNANKIKV